MDIQKILEQYDGTLLIHPDMPLDENSSTGYYGNLGHLTAISELQQKPIFFLPWSSFPHHQSSRTQFPAKLYFAWTKLHSPVFPNEESIDACIGQIGGAFNAPVSQIKLAVGGLSAGVCVQIIGRMFFNQFISPISPFSYYLNRSNGLGVGVVIPQLTDIAEVKKGITIYL